MDIQKIKSIERKKFKILQKNITTTEKNNVKKNVEIFIQKQFKKNCIQEYISIYWPLDGEIDLRNLKEKYPLALPKCKKNRNLDFYIWDNTKLVKDIHGIPSSNSGCRLKSSEISLILVPCLSIDKNFVRLGYGGGYFDRLRSNLQWRKIPCMGVLPEKCVSKDLFNKADWDIPLSGYITDKEILV